MSDDKNLPRARTHSWGPRLHAVVKFVPAVPAKPWCTRPASTIPAPVPWDTRT